MQRLAREDGARLHDGSPVTSMDVEDDGSVTVVAGGSADRTVRARRLVLTADAWTNDLLAHLGTSLPLTVTREQVTYFDAATPDGVRAPAGCRCGSGWTTRRSTASRRTTKAATVRW